jgi:GDP-mannose 6-dehydrogenase
VSPAYLRPGFAFGGSCLPKDVRALLHLARQHDVDLPLLFSILPSNQSHAERAMARVLELGRRRVGLYGLAFKGGTDDLRESPMVELAERLVGKGFRLQIYDPNVALSRLIGANRSFIDERLPHLAELMTDDADVVAQESDIVIAATADPAVVAAIDAAPPDVEVLDLVRLPGAERRRQRATYHGIGW